MDFKRKWDLKIRLVLKFKIHICYYITNYDIIDWKWEQINDFKEVF